MKLRFSLFILVSLLINPSCSRAQTSADPNKISARAKAYVDRRIAGKSPGASLNIFAGGDLGTGKGLVRNPQLWCAQLGLTCFSPWNSTEHNLQAGTLLTPRHVLLANHFSNPYTGTPPMVPGITTMEFVATDNTVYLRTIKKLIQVKNTDLLIGTLDQDLPDKIVPVEVFPADKGATIPKGTPVIYTTQDKVARIGEFSATSGPLFAIQPATGDLAPWSAASLARVGDSGSPIFLPLSGRAILIGHFFFPNGGPMTGMYTAEINAITGPGYPVKEASLLDKE